MLVLGIESATPVASAALADETGLLGELLLNVGLTHSEQLLPMIDSLLRQCRRAIGDVTAIGVSAGPGSFTGLRIGMATAKALAQGLSHRRGAVSNERVPVLAIPTLEAMAWAMAGQPVYVSPMLNARREQLYTGLYKWKETEATIEPTEATEPTEPTEPTASSSTASGAHTSDVDAEQALRQVFASRQRGKKDRLPASIGDTGLTLTCHIEPQAVSPEAWAATLAVVETGEGQTPAIYLLGDGAAMYREIWERNLGERAHILPPVTGLSRGSFIAFAAMERLGRDDPVADRPSPEQTILAGDQAFYAMKPIYLRGI